MTLGVSNLGIDGLEDIEQIGTGGSSRVYRARQTELDRVVAVKVLNPGHDQSVAKRFDRERKAMGRLSLHEGIVPVYTSGLTTHGEPYLVMPYYANGSLQDQIDTGAMEWQTAVSYVDVAAETIAAAHDEGVVHLDLKPANILLTNNGAPRIADFGIARLTAGEGASAGTTGGAAFTPAYSAPETFLDGETGPPSDVYGLGATLWALLVGHPPFLTPGDDTNLMAVIGRVVNNPVGDLRHFTPSPICDVIERAMTKRPEDRYQTAREFSLDLKNAAAASSPDFDPVDDEPRGTILFPSAAPSALGDNSETQMLTRMDPVELPPSIASTAPPPPARPLLQETAQPLPQQMGGPPPIGDGPVFDLDRFRFGPILLGLIAFVGVVALGFWAINRSAGTDADGPGVAVTDPASPTTDSPDQSVGAGGDAGQSTSSQASSSTTSTTEATTSSTPTSQATTTTQATSSSASTTEASTSSTGSTSTTDASTTTSESTTTTGSSTTVDSTTTTADSTPNPPTGLSATVDGATVNLTWSAPASGPTPGSYRVFQSGQALSPVTLTTSYTVQNLSPGTYTFVVRSVGEDGDSGPSNSQTVQVEGQSGPPSLDGFSLSSTTSSVTASFSSDQCVTYRVSVLDLDDPGASPVTVTGPASGCRTSHDVTITDLAADTRYRVSVIVQNGSTPPGEANEVKTIRTAA